MKKSKLLFVVVSIFCSLLTKGGLIQAATQDEDVRKVTISSEFLENDSLGDNGLVSTASETFVAEDGITYTLTTEVFKEELLPLEELLQKQRGLGNWTSCFASPGTYRIVAKIHVNHKPFDAMAIGNVIINLTSSSVSIKDVNTGGTSSENSTVTPSATKVNSTFARFDYKVYYPGNSVYNPQTTYLTTDVQVAHGYSGSQLLYRYIVNAYY